MSIPLQPSSPSARQLRQPSPTSPCYAEHQYRRTLLDDVKLWPEAKVTEWLHNQSLKRFSQKFTGNNNKAYTLFGTFFFFLHILKNLFFFL